MGEDHGEELIIYVVCISSALELHCRKRPCSFKKLHFESRFCGELQLLEDEKVCAAVSLRRAAEVSGLDMLDL